MSNYIARKIIGKYERSKDFRCGIQEGNRSLNFRKDKYYMKPENYKKREEINEEAKSMEKQQLVKIVWDDYNNFINKIRYSLEKIEIFYELSGKQRKDVVLSKEIKKITSTIERISTPWIKQYFIDKREYIGEKRKLDSHFKSKKEYIYDTLLGLDNIIQNNDVMLERVFSKKYLKNSKLFELKMRTTLASIIKSYNSDLTNLEDDEILRFVGIEKTASDLDIKGNIKIELDNQVIDLGKFIYGTTLNIETLKNCRIVEIKALRIVSIENKANFKYELQANNNDLFVFSSGFYSPIEREFLIKVRDFLDKTHSEVEYLHSGDLDFGGFNIFIHIKNTIFPQLKPYKMNKDLYLKYIDYAEPFNVNKIKSLIDKPGYEVFQDLIKEIIRHEKFLEQEAFLIN